MPPTAAQRRANLIHAEEARLGIAAVKREVAAGVLTVREALWDPRAQSMTTFTLLKSQRRWGARRARRVLAGLYISEVKRLKMLTERQRHVLAAECE